MARIQLNYLPFQQIIFNDPHKFIVVAKGRRLGFTRGCFMYCFSKLIEGQKILWVDTVLANCHEYYNLFLEPLLAKLPSASYKFNLQHNIIKLNNGGSLKFHSTEKAGGKGQRLEGFGYDLVILNEAGLILGDKQGEDLWRSSILPMMLDNPNSKAIIGGAPKSESKYFEKLWERGANPAYPNWQAFRFSTYDNPLHSREDVETIIKEVGSLNDPIVRQEIFGEFVKVNTSKLFNENMIDKVVDYFLYDTEKGFDDLLGEGEPIIWGVDVARYGDDKSVIAKRQGLLVKELLTFDNLNGNELYDVLKAEYLKDPFKPDCIFIDPVGVGVSLLDNITRDGALLFVIREAHFSHKADNRGYLNKRAEAYFSFAKNFVNMQICFNETLKDDLSMIQSDFAETGALKIISKKEIYKKYKRSPDLSDAIALTYFEKVYKQDVYHESFKGCNDYLF